MRQGFWHAPRERETLLIFLSDNGSPRSGKGQLTEGGTRVPSLIRWPARIEAGRTSDALIDFSDFLPTLVEAAGGDAPSAAAIDGRSFLPLLDGVGPPPRTWVFSEFDSNYFVRDDRWKLDSEGLLFDLQAPPEIAERVEAPVTPDSARAREKLSQVLVELGLVAPQRER